MEPNRDNFEESGDERWEESSNEAFERDENPADPREGASAPEHRLETRAGDEWFDRTWLRANGARVNEAGDVERIADAGLGFGTGRVPVLVLLADAIETALPGEEMESRLRAWGGMAWHRRRARRGTRARVPTLLEQMERSDRARQDWIDANPFAAFWVATAVGQWKPRRRRPPRR